MPERMAGHTDAFTMVKDHTGSGPFVFLKDEWVSGSRAAFRRNERYVPRQEKPSLYAGGKAVHFDRVEWITIPDPATAMGAISNGEIDWWENPVPDLLPKLRKSPGVIVEQIDPDRPFRHACLQHQNPAARQCEAAPCFAVRGEPV